MPRNVVVKLWRWVRWMDGLRKLQWRLVVGYVVVRSSL